jgi:hypothetical protein
MPPRTNRCSRLGTVALSLTDMEHFEFRIQLPIL